MEVVEKEGEVERRIRGLLEVCRDVTPLVDETFEAYVKARCNVMLILEKREWLKDRDIRVSWPVFLHVALVKDTYTVIHYLGEFRVVIEKWVWIKIPSRFSYVLNFNVSEVQRIG